MSKYLKNLIVDDIRRRLDGVQDALVVNVVGMEPNQTTNLRRRLREKNIELLVVKTSLARRATEKTSLSAAFHDVTGPLALVYGAEDFVSLTKEIVSIGKTAEFAKFETKGGVLDGEHLSAAKVAEVSKWPNRVGQISILIGQILSPGARLLSQINAPGGALASQIEQKSKEEQA